VISAEYRQAGSGLAFVAARLFQKKLATANIVL